MFSSYDRLTGQLKKIQEGDPAAREDFLREYQPFVAKVATTMCKRFLEWGRDDELSIGLIAFNHAIDHFKIEKEIPFLPYAQVVIQNKLKDYFKSHGKIQYESLWIENENEESFSPGEIKAAWETFQNRTIEDERQQEIEFLDHRLGTYQIEFEDLVVAAPKHKDTRKTLVSVAKTIVNNESLLSYVKQKKQLPIKELCLSTKTNRKTLERGRKFIIALVEILSHPEDYIYIRSYIQLD